MELKRAAKSPILWLGVIAVIAINVYGILLNGYGFKIFTTTFLLENSDLICIILAVLIPLYLGSDFENRTINNKISAGYTRKEIYIVELIVSSICATVLFVADILSVFTSSNIAGLEFSDKVNVTEFAFHAAIAFVCIITVSALYTMIVMISHKQLISLGIAVILTLALLTLGGKSVSSLNQSSTWTDPINNTAHIILKQSFPVYCHFFQFFPAFLDFPVKHIIFFNAFLSLIQPPNQIYIFNIYIDMCTYHTQYIIIHFQISDPRYVPG